MHWGRDEQCPCIRLGEEVRRSAQSHYHGACGGASEMHHFDQLILRSGSWTELGPNWWNFWIFFDLVARSRCLSG
jgi:hypothetical protein